MRDILLKNRDIITGIGQHELFDGEALSGHVDAYIAGNGSADLPVWRILNLAVWMNKKY